MKKSFIQLSVGVVLSVFTAITVEAAKITESSSTGFLYDGNPVAVFSINPTAATCYQSISFDGSASYHTDPARVIVKYEWDFDAPSLNEFQVEKTGMLVTHSYPLLGLYKAWLRVTDDLGSTSAVSKIIDVNLGNLPPIADAGGPYISPLDSSIVLDGQGSTDPNMPCDQISSYLWDINNDGSFGDLTGPNPTLVVSSPFYQAGRFYQISLRVTDLLGLLSNISATTLQVQDPVPIELSAFGAKVKGTVVILSWRTETETNNYGFEIERSIKSELPNWSNIGFILGRGNSNSPMEYSFTDRNPLGGSKFLYRLKQIDSDGKFDYSGVVEIEILAVKRDLYQNYPNPFNPGTVISYQLPVSGDVVLRVFDVLGNEIATLVNEYKPAGRYDVEFQSAVGNRKLASGVYFYQLKAGEYISTKKMILLK